MQALASAGGRQLSHSAGGGGDSILLKGLVFHGYHGVLEEVGDCVLVQREQTSQEAWVALTGDEPPPALCRRTAWGRSSW